MHIAQQNKDGGCLNEVKVKKYLEIHQAATISIDNHKVASYSSFQSTDEASDNGSSSLSISNLQEGWDYQSSRNLIPLEDINKELIQELQRELHNEFNRFQYELDLKEVKSLLEEDIKNGNEIDFVPFPWIEEILPEEELSFNTEVEAARKNVRSIWEMVMKYQESGSFEIATVSLFTILVGIFPEGKDIFPNLSSQSKYLGAVIDAMIIECSDSFSTLSKKHSILG
eukprot:Awhi_evm1s10251